MEDIETISVAMCQEQLFVRLTIFIRKIIYIYDDREG